MNKFTQQPIGSFFYKSYMSKTYCNQNLEIKSFMFTILKKIGMKYEQIKR